MPCSLEFVMNDLLVWQAYECLTMVKHMSNLPDGCGILQKSEKKRKKKK